MWSIKILSGASLMGGGWAAENGEANFGHWVGCAV